ncbi:hypothetical protein D3C76_974340 [compost metagenome]
MQAVDDVEAVVEIIELLATGVVVEHFGQRALAAGEQFQRGGVGRVDLVGQWLLIARQQAAQAFVVDTFPHRFGGGEAGLQGAQGRLATPRIGLERLRHAFALAAHRRAELFLQGIEGGHLHAQ